MSMMVSQIAQTPPPKVKITAMVDEAIRAMRNARGGAVVVVDQGRLTGIFTERDVLLRVAAVGKEPVTTFVREVMTSPVETVSEECPVIEALEKMTARHIRHFPVLDSTGRLTGLVSMRNILMHVIDGLKEKSVGE